MVDSAVSSRAAVSYAFEALSQGLPHAAVEHALVARFLAENGLSPASGGVLEGVLAEDASSLEERAAAGSVLSGWFPAGVLLSLDDLVMAFETLVPPAEAKRFGAVFTPSEVTSFMASESISRLSSLGVPSGSVSVLDPAVGCGALLVAVLKEVVACSGEAPEVVSSRLFGVDVSEDSVRRAKVLLSLAALSLGGDEPDLSANLVVADTLTSDVSELFEPDVFSLVIANPPYVRYQNLELEQRSALSDRWVSCGKGNFNLYFPFFEVAYAAADPSGSVVCFITPNNFTTSLSGGLLRSWMVERRFLSDLVDFGHHRVFEAMTYTAVSFAERAEGRSSEGFGYIPVPGLPGLSGFLDGWPEDDLELVLWRDLGAKPWSLVGGRHAEGVRRVRAAGPLLSEVADIRFGVATCRDRLYLLDGRRDSDGFFVKQYKDVVYRVEPGLARPCVKVSSVASQAELDVDRTAIVYPYVLSAAGSDEAEPVRASVMGEDVLRESFPQGFRYLSAVRSDLAGRDGGRKRYPAWFAYGRTQSIVPSGDKLLTPLYAGSPRILRDVRDDSLFVNGCSVQLSGQAPDWLSLDLLAVLLSSGLCRFFVESTSVAITGGFYSYQKSQLGGLSVPASLASFDSSGLSSGEVDDALADLFGIDLPERFRRS